MTKQHVIAVTLVTFLLQSPQSIAAEVETYTLFNPTPRGQMRDLSPDRPGAADSPYTVDAGHFQIESELVRYTQQQEDETTKTRTFSLNSLNVTTGITNNSDLQIVLPAYISKRTETGEVQKNSGIGDLTIRYKVNLMGNNGGQMAAAVLASVKAPTNTGQLGNKKVEGGIHLPFVVTLPEEWSLGFMPQIDWINDGGEQKSYHAEFLSIFSVGRGIATDLDGYLEFISQSSSAPSSKWSPKFGGGLTYQIGRDIQLDAALEWGLNSPSYDFSPSAGIVVRF